MACSGDGGHAVPQKKAKVIMEESEGPKKSVKKKKKKIKFDTAVA